MNSAVELWQRYQDWLYYHSELGIYLDVSRIKFTSEFVTQIQSKFVKAFGDMKALELGAIANPDEQRMVGHYWLRSPELAPTEELRKDITETLDRLEDFTKKVHAGLIHPAAAPRFTDILSIGIGGSALGPQFVAQCFAKADVPLKISFIDNSDPDGIDLVFDLLGDRLSTTLVLVISKSGGTPEAANGMKEAEFFFQKAGLDFAKHAIAVTGVGSALEKYAIANNWLDKFPMYDWIGGRTSELSAVGLLPAALQGIDIREMLRGAKVMDAATRIEDVRQNPAALLAMSWYFATNGKGDKDMVVLPYKDRLLLFSRYLQQLVMESLGKEKDLDGNIVYQGIAVYGNKGSTDQHAYVQQLREGVSNFFATFIEVLQDSARPHPEMEAGVVTGDYLLGFLQGTRSALYENGRDSITITIPVVSEVTVGALIALYERAVSFYASLVNINAYHQPGVEAGKKAGAEVLTLQKQLIAVLKSSKVSLSLEEVAIKIDAPNQIEALYHVARHLHANCKILFEGDLSRPTTLKMMLID